MENTTTNQNSQLPPETKTTDEISECNAISLGTPLGYLGVPLDVCTDVMKLRSLVEFLFQRLDDIDTLSDMCKGDNESYRRLAEQ